MKLVLQQPFLSISELEPIELPEFTVLTGVNGSGKSHLLRAIDERKVVIEGLPNPHIVLFNYETFRLENEGRFTSHDIANERTSAWNYFTTDKNSHIAQQLKNFKNSYLSDSFSRIEEAAGIAGRSIWYLERTDVESQEDYDHLENYRNNVRNFFITHPHVKGRNEGQSIFAMVKRISRFADDLSESEFNTYYDPYTLKSDFLPTHLGKAFANYFARFDDNRYANYQNHTYGENRNALTDDEFVELHGPKPWDIVNQVLERIGSVPYRVNSPESEELSRYDHYRASLVHIDNPGIRPEFSDLSSGERILMAVVASVYKSSSDRHFPDILLLDEVDASLHPSMIQNLIDVVQDIFLKNGVRVLLVTHSPTTIALSSESSVFVMNRGGVQRIEKRSRRDALEILTEGFATLEEGIRILDEVARTPVSVLTEGRNVSFIRAALDHAAIDGVDVVSGVEGSSGSGQLRTLYDLFTAVPHENKVIIVWDCDANSYRKLPSKNRTFPFVFEPNPNNNVARAGVENLFSQDLVEPFAMRTERPNGEVQVRFDGAEKVRFEEHVIERGNQGDFVRFEPLMNLIREVSAG